MSTHYSSIINYIIEDMKVSHFDFQQIIIELRELLQNDKDSLWDKIEELRVQFEIEHPDFGMIDDFYNQKIIKSHELEAVIDKISDQIVNAIRLLLNKLDYTINNYILFKESISIKQHISYKREKGKRTIRKDHILMEFKTAKLTLEDIIAFLLLWHIDELHFARQVLIRIYVNNLGNKNPQIILNRNLGKKKGVNVKSFLSSMDIELTLEILGHENYHKLFNSFVFPEGFSGNAEITLDVANKDKIPSKRRTVTVNGTKMRFHEIITKNMAHKDYQEILQQNKILGFYISTKSTQDELLYLLIDIDIPNLFFNLFSANLVWTFALNLTKAINESAIYLGLPSFKIMFSGKRGLHLLARVKKNVILDIENYVNLPELYDYGVIPGIKTLKKEKKSSLKDKFKFAKSLLQSLLLYTVYKRNIEIPKEIKYKLGIVHPYQLFSLSPSSKNVLSILLDCSSQSRGVFRFFSPHPLSKKVSIPINDLKSGKFCERYLDFENVLEDAKIQSVIKQFNDNNLDLYLQKPPCITRSQIRELLRPDKLFPSFAILLRFGTLHAIKRSPYSFAFWHRFYELKKFYSYIDTLVHCFEGENLKEFFAYIENLGARLKILNLTRIISNLRLYLIHEKISYPILKQNLSTLYQIEFFFNLKSSIVYQINNDQLSEFFQNDLLYTNFLNQAKHVFQVSLDIISNHLVLNDIGQFSIRQKDCLRLLYKKILSLNGYLRKLNNAKEGNNRKELLVYVIYVITEFYSYAIEFVRNFFSERYKMEES
ncbi:MAG: hypothetical protein ACFFBI_00355 [Promethearchaeota archaeon]